MPARSSLAHRLGSPFRAFTTRPVLFGLLTLGVAVTARATLFAQADALGAPRWMAQERMPGPRTADAVAMERTLLAFVERVKQLPVLTPPPGVYPKATLTFEKKGDVLVSKTKLPAGEGYNLVVHFKQTVTAKPQNFRLKLDLATCGECKRPEYACTCGH